MRRFLMAPAVLALVTVAGCRDIYGVGGRDFEGVYAYAGTVDGLIGDVVLGQVTITRQRYGSALVALDWSYLQGGDETIHITTQTPAEAVLDADGYISFEFNGQLLTSGRSVSFHLQHDGRLRGNTMTGDWRFSTGLPSTDTGGFTASRDRY